MNRLKAAVGILAIFVLGTMAGAVGSSHLMKQRIRDYAHGPEPPLAMILRRLSHELNLTADQQEKIRPILEKTRTRLTELRKKYKPEFQSVFDESTQEMKTVLTKDQGSQLDRLHERMKNRPEPPRRPPGGGPGEEPPPGLGPMPLENADQLMDWLNLTPGQKASTRSLMEQSIAQKKAMKEAMDREQESFADRFRALEEKSTKQLMPLKKELSAILDTGQMDEYLKVMTPHNPFRPPGPRPD